MVILPQYHGHLCYFTTARSTEDLRQFAPPEDVPETSTLMKSASRIFFTGLGASSFIAFDAYHKLPRLGQDVHARPDTHLVSIVACHAGGKDLFFAVSRSGDSRTWSTA